MPKRLLAVITMAFVASLGVIPVGVAYAASSSLGSGGTLTTGQYITSPNGVFVLVMQSDGNLVEDMASPAGDALWSTGTSGHPGSYAVMQGDGNLVVYSPGGAPLWWSGTQGHPGAYLLMQSDANLVIYGSNGALWADSAQTSVLGSSGTLWPGQSLTSTNGQYTLVMQLDGNLVEYTGSTVVWYSHTQGNNAAHATMQNNGLLAIVSTTGQRVGAFFSIPPYPTYGVYYLVVPVYGNYFAGSHFAIAGPY